MRRRLALLTLSLATLPFLATGAQAASEGERLANHPKTVDLTVTCPSGVVSGVSPYSSALLLDQGGVAVLHGLVTAPADGSPGQVIVPIHRGLERAGKLEICTYVSPTLGPSIAYVLFAPPQR